MVAGPPLVLAFSHNVGGRGASYRAEQLLSRHPGGARLVLYVGATGEASQEERGAATIVRSPSRLREPLRSGWSLGEGRWRIRHAEALLAGHGGPPDLVVAFDSRPSVLAPALHFAGRYKARLHADVGDYWWFGGAALMRRPLWASRAFEPVEHVLLNRLVARAGSATTVSPRLREEIARRRPDLDCPIVLNGTSVGEPPEADPPPPGETRPVRLVAGGGAAYDMEYYEAVVEALDAAGADTELWVTGLAAGKFPDRPRVRRFGNLSFDEYTRTCWRADYALAPLGPTVANEARCPGRVPAFLGCGLSVLTTRVGVWADVVEELDVGQALPPSPEAYADGVLDAAKVPVAAAERERIWRVSRRYDWSHLAEEFAAALHLPAPGSGD